MLSAVALFMAAVLVCSASDEQSTEAANSEVLAESLRRQLMKDNYDYMSYESKDTKMDKTTHNQKIYSIEEMKKIDTKHRLKYDLKSNTEHEIGSQRSKISSLSDDVKEIKDETSEEHSSMQLFAENLKHEINNQETQIRKKEIIPKYKNEETKRSRQTNQISYEEDTFTYQKLYTTTVKYKVLKVRHGYRRSGGKRTMLIQEETPESVAIVNLGNGPIPQFRLPLTRRQYMHDPLDIGAFGDDDELLPPPINDTFSSEEIDQTNNSILLKTTPVEKLSN